MSAWNRVFKPILVLGVICIVVTGALAYTNSITAPLIEEASHRAHNQARNLIMPEASVFTPAQGIDVPSVSEVYVADNNKGVVITARAHGYKGKLTVMVGINGDGVIQRIRVTEQSETRGIGSKVADDASYWAQFEGLPAEPLALNRDVDAVSGATVSSKALLAAVNSAIEAYRAWS